MVERDLTIKVTATTAEAQAQVDELATSVEKVGTAAQGASAEQVAATQAVITATENLQAAVNAAVPAMMNGGQQASAAFRTVLVPVAELQVAIDGLKATSADGVIPPASVALLNEWAAGLQASGVSAAQLAEAVATLTSAHAAAVPATEADAAAHAAFAGALAAGLAVAGPAATATASLGVAEGEQAVAAGASAVATEGSTAAIAASRTEINLARGSVGGLAMAVGGIGGAFSAVVLPLLILVSTILIAERVAHAFGITTDGLVTAMGGVPKAVEASTQSLATLQSKLTDLDVTQRAFASSTDLLTAAGLEEEKAFQAIYAVTATAAGFFDSARMASDRLVTGIEIVRTVSQDAGTVLQAGLIKALLDVQNGVPGAIEALDQFVKKEKEEEAVALEFKKSLDDTYGKGASDAFAKMDQAAAEAAKAMLALRDAGLSDDEVFAALKSQLLVVTDGMNRFGLAVAEEAKKHPELVRALLDEVAALAPLAKGKDLVTLATEKHIKALADEAKAEEDAKQKVINLGLAEEKLAQSYETSLAKIREHTTVLVAGAEAELKAITAAADKEIAVLNSQFAQGVISREAYNARINALLGIEIAARRATQDKENLIYQEDAAAKQAATDKFVTASLRLQEQLIKEGASFAEAKVAADAYVEAHKHDTDAIVANAAAIAAGMVTHQGYETQIKADGKALDLTGKSLADLGKAEDLHTTGINSRHVPAAAAMAKAHGEVTAAAEKLAGVMPAVTAAIGAADTAMGGVSVAADGMAKDTDAAFNRMKLGAGEWVEVVKTKVAEVPKVVTGVTLEMEAANEAAWAAMEQSTAVHCAAIEHLAEMTSKSALESFHKLTDLTAWEVFSEGVVKALAAVGKAAKDTFGDGSGTSGDGMGSGTSAPGVGP